MKDLKHKSRKNQSQREDIPSFLSRLATLIFGTLLLGGCQEQENLFLEAAETQFLKVQTSLVGQNTEINVSGLAFHSALAVQDISTLQEKEELVVLVKLTPTKKGLSGSFQYKILLPEKINKVSFGQKRKVIWERNQPLEKASY